jgi:hypothetical protein
MTVKIVSLTSKVRSVPYLTIMVTNHLGKYDPLCDHNGKPITQLYSSGFAERRAFERAAHCASILENILLHRDPDQ